MPIYTAECEIRSKPKSDSNNWGGILSIEFAALDTGIYTNSIYDSYFGSPSITLYDSSQIYQLYWDKIQSGFADSIVHISGNAFGGGDFSLDISKFLLYASNVRTLCQPFSRYIDSMDDREIWVQDSADTHILHRGNYHGITCDASDNYANVPLTGYNRGIALVHDSIIKFMSGEYQLITKSGAATALQLQQIPLTTAYHSIKDAANLMRSQNFHVTADTMKIGSFSTLMINDTNVLRSLDTTMLTFVTELRDSATGNLLQTLNETMVFSSSPFVGGPIGTDTVKIIGDSGKTCYIRLTIDTMKTGTGFSFIPSQVLSETQLSTLGAPPPPPPPPPPLPCAAGFGKALQSALPSDPINLTAAPNPFYPKSDISFTVPASSGGQPVSIIVYAMDGQAIAVLVNNEPRNAGCYTSTFDGTNLPSGSYLVVARMADCEQSLRISLVK